MRIDHGQSHLIAAGSAVGIVMPGTPWTVCVFPAAGATASVQITATPLFNAEVAVLENDLRWVDLQTNLSDPTAITYPGPVTALRVSAAGGDVTLDFIDSETR
jgi:integral membrane sensor domain MASE1